MKSRAWYLGDIPTGSRPVEFYPSAICLSGKKIVCSAWSRWASVIYKDKLLTKKYKADEVRIATTSV